MGNEAGEVRKNEREMLEAKNTVKKIKNALDGLIRKLSEANERITGLEYRSKKKKKKNFPS
jgi:hypothetical protein